MSQIRVAIAGASGRMGRMLIEAALKEEGVVLAAAFDRSDAPFIGRDAGEMAGVATGVTKAVGSAASPLPKSTRLLAPPPASATLGPAAAWIRSSPPSPYKRSLPPWPNSRSPPAPASLPLLPKSP